MTASTYSLTAQDALNDIEIELLQGAVTRDDLGQSVQNVRRFQNQVRGEALDRQARPDYRAIANRQFQINDMLLTLAQETATRLAALELELRKAERAGLRRNPLPFAAPTAPTAEAAGAQVSSPVFPPEQGEAEAGAETPAAAQGGASESQELVRRLDAIRSAMREDALALQLEVTPTETPLIGRFVGGARAALHSLVVFYSSRLAAKQGEINHTYGDTLGWLLEARAADREALEALTAEIAQLRARLDAGQASGPRQ